MSTLTKVSLVTASMDRTDHLIESVTQASIYGNHDEHIILDWSSTIPITDDIFPKDDRIKIYRINGEVSWWASRAYNAAIHFSSGETIVRLDADVIIKSAFFKEIDFNQYTFQTISGVYGRYPGSKHAISKGSSGFFVTPRYLIEDIGGFNEYMRGWGFEDLDLYIRVYQSSACVKKIIANYVESISHEHYRSYSNEYRGNELEIMAIKRANRAYNNRLGEFSYWDKTIQASVYQPDGTGGYVIKQMPAPVVLDKTQSTLLVNEVIGSYLRERSKAAYLLHKIIPRLTNYLYYPTLKPIFENPLVHLSY